MGMNMRPKEGGMIARKIIISLIIVIMAVAVVLKLALWNSKGGLGGFISGQKPPAQGLDRRDASARGGSGPDCEVTVRIAGDRVVSETEPEFISFAIDTSQLVGSLWWNPKADAIEREFGGAKRAVVFDFNRPKLDMLAKALSPAYLRLGGTEADKVFYDPASAEMYVEKAPTGYKAVLTGAQWDRLNAFVKRNSLRLVFTLNAGPSSRNPDGSWNPENAEALLAHAAKKGQAVSLWELGNELNLYWFGYGISKRVSAGQYGKDLLRARELVRKYQPGSMFAGQGSAFWPVLGEPLQLFFGTAETYLGKSGPLYDLVSWHYYPQQSRRGAIASRRAHPARLLDPAMLDEAAHWAKYVSGLRDRYAPGKPLWLGETGNAQYGGEPGVSDVYIGGLWWLDELGLLARLGYRVVVRQTLCGSNYGMIDEAGLEPRPDYWNSLVWKKLMGRRVFEAKVEGEGGEQVRVYAHGAKDGGGTSVLVINLHRERNAVVSLPGMKGKDYTVYAMNAPDVLGGDVLLNGKRLALDSTGRIPELKGIAMRGAGVPVVTVHPLSYTFVEFER
jgi:heparanase